MGDQRELAQALAEAIDAVIANPPLFAKANGKGKFPMAAMDIVPLTHAITEEKFELIRNLVVAAVNYRRAGPDLLRAAMEESK